jgi:hypothetical protein
MRHVCWVAVGAFAVSNVGATPATIAGVALFNGEITHEAVAAFFEKYDRRSDLIEFSVASQGGDVLASLKLARWIRVRKLNVRVRNLCFSGCANYLFVAGEKKFIEDGAFVGWHGDAAQKDFRKLVSKYKRLLQKRTLVRALSREESRFLDEYRVRYDGLTKAQREQSEFYKLVGVDPMMGRFGQEPINYPSDAWTFTLPAMAILGIKNVQGEADYGREGYFRRAGPMAIMMNGGPVQVFDSLDGKNIVPIQK